MGATTGIIYGLVSRLPDQLALVKAHCFGTCGKIIVGAINGEELGIGDLFPCRIPAQDCPRFDKEGGPFGEVDGDELYIRKLK